MFEHLDDPHPPAAPPVAAVAARGAGIRRRRLAWSGGGAALAGVAVLALTLRPVGRPESVRVVGPTPSPTASPSPAAPTPPTPSPLPTSVFPGLAADGRPGWIGVGAGCLGAHREQSVAPHPDLAITLTLDTDRVVPRGSFTGTLRVTNQGGGTVRLRTDDDGHDGTLLDAGGRPLAGRLITDVNGGRDLTLGPGAAYERRVTVGTEQCGDTSADRPAPVPPGRYWVYAALRWEADAGKAPVWWYAPPVPVTVAG